MDKPRDTDENIGHKTHSEDNNKKKNKKKTKRTNKQTENHTHRHPRAKTSHNTKKMRNKDPLKKHV